jgi:hypothetical protein
MLNIPEGTILLISAVVIVGTRVAPMGIVTGALINSGKVKSSITLIQYPLLLILAATVVKSAQLY